MTERPFDQLSDEQLDSISAVIMDMWDPFIKAVNDKAPHVKMAFSIIVFSQSLLDDLRALTTK